MVKFTVLDCFCMRWITKVNMLHSEKGNSEKEETHQNIKVCPYISDTFFLILIRQGYSKTLLSLGNPRVPKNQVLIFHYGIFKLVQLESDMNSALKEALSGGRFDARFHERYL